MGSGFPTGESLLVSAVCLLLSASIYVVELLGLINRIVFVDGWVVHSRERVLCVSPPRLRVVGVYAGIAVAAVPLLVVYPRVTHAIMALVGVGLASFYALHRPHWAPMTKRANACGVWAYTAVALRAVLSLLPWTGLRHALGLAGGVALIALCVLTVKHEWLSRVRLSCDEASSHAYPPVRAVAAARGSDRGRRAKSWPLGACRQCCRTYATVVALANLGKDEISNNIAEPRVKKRSAREIPTLFQLSISAISCECALM